jgi:hypothetical protein
MRSHLIVRSADEIRVAPAPPPPLLPTLYCFYRSCEKVSASNSIPFAKCPIVIKASCRTGSASLVSKGPIFIEGGNPVQSTTTRSSPKDLLLDFLNYWDQSAVRFHGAQEFGKSLSFQAFCREGGIFMEPVALLVLLNNGTCRILEQISESNLFIDDKGSHMLIDASSSCR